MAALSAERSVARMRCSVDGLFLNSDHWGESTYDLALSDPAVREQVIRDLGQRVDGFLPAKAV
jgi:hypothetical protein